MLLAGAVAAAGLTAAGPDVACVVEDPLLTELSGMAVDGDGLWAISDGGRRVDLHRLDPSTCAITDTRTAAIDPYDAEDLATGPDPAGGGPALWVADTGDNERARDTVAVVVVPARGDARLHRLTYPDGPHDAEALLVDPTGRPVVITKEAGRPAGVYRPAEPLEGTGPTPLLRVGDVALPASDTVGGPIGDLGSRVVTGAAASSDGRVVALRSYTDAWLYPAPDGDPVAALAAVPVRVPLPDGPQGEAIAFTADGTLLSGSERRGGRPGQIRAVTAATGLLPGVAAVEPEPPTAARQDGPAPEWVPAAIGGGVATGVLLLLAAAFAVRRR